MYQNHRINFQIGNHDFYTCLKIMTDLKKEIPDCNIVLAIDDPITKEELDTLYEAKIPFYFLKTVTSLDEFHYFMKLKVCDIVIGGDLAFYVKFLSKFAKKNSIKLRATVDLCQTYPLSPSFKGFFIRPEDIDIYAHYIDTFDFAHPEDKINTMYEIYAKDKKWYGKLNEIIIGYSGWEDSRFILPTFAEIRCGCKRRCLYDIDNPCKICDRIVELSQTLEEKKIVVEVEHGEESN